jgi:hypothetical protein
MRQRADSNLRCDLYNQRFEGIVEKRAAAEYAANLRKEEPLLLQLQGLDDAGRKLEKLFRRRTENRLRRRIAFVCGFRDDGKDFWQDTLRIRADLVLQLLPVAVKRAEYFATKWKILAVTEMTQTEHRSLSADVVGAARIPEQWAEPPFASEAAGRRPQSRCRR